MKNFWFILVLLFYFLLAACTEKTNTVVQESDGPEKLYAYEITYDAPIFKQRRDQLISQIEEDAMVVVTTNSTYLRNGDVDYEFRPASNFYYLTGFDEPNAVALIKRNSSGQTDSELIMFVETREGNEITWLGPVTGLEETMQYFGADTAYENEAFGPLVEQYIQNNNIQKIYHNLEQNEDFSEAFETYIHGSYEMFILDEIVDGMRMIKSPLEYDAIQSAVDVSVQAFEEAMKTIEPGMYEYEAEAVFDYIIALNGCPRTAFPTIVASGPPTSIRCTIKPIPGRCRMANW